MSTGTPRCDNAATFRPNDNGVEDYVHASMARQLERELIDAIRQKQALQNAAADVANAAAVLAECVLASKQNVGRPMLAKAETVLDVAARLQTLTS